MTDWKRRTTATSAAAFRQVHDVSPSSKLEQASSMASRGTQ